MASRVEKGVANDSAEGPGTKPAPRRVWLLEGRAG